MSFKVESLIFSYKDNVNILNGIFFEIEKGDIVAILGRNGSGKTTLFNCLTVTNIHSGSIFHNNQYIDYKERSKHIAYLPQKNFLPSSEKVINIIKMFPFKKQQIDQISSDRRISELLNRKAHLLSGGEKRYLEFLLVHNLNKEIYILDEPFSEIEPIYENIICEKINRDRHQRYYIITDHKYQKVIELCNKIFVLTNGVLKYVTSVEALSEYKYLV